MAEDLDQEHIPHPLQSEEPGEGELEDMVVVVYLMVEMVQRVAQTQEEAVEEEADRIRMPMEKEEPVAPASYFSDYIKE